ncbi:carbohydrate ABC transporter permease [Lachnoclostridium phytofermentans]|uniref:Binding-protein-dependent transport systems inner membrane component n=1 Tax=Lachnoclostridium phytofermentans (strain ATCC 700394 / DSM 18823 / ISDg) TaxID=357809 RepID=A9KSL8_LACP7|nr:sugar ABC transporter permease [Lachnoclostridium phytofermentans]ABX43670.1 binding-protein-dependent transport systems inner membrane component [Lachnoclostridium phytofermentans ISDg]
MKEKKKVPKTSWKKKDFLGWMIMLPSIILFAFFVWEPLIESVRLSLYTAKGIHTEDFVGFDNYLRVLRHPDFMDALKNTFVYIGWSLVIGFAVPIIIALLITETIHFRSLFRVGVYFPNIIPGLATVMLWGFFFRPGNTGVLNILLSKIGIESQKWLNNAALTIPLIVLTMTWKSAGSTSLIYMAGISGINPELYEAATIDGAGIRQRIRFITLPSVFSLAKTLLILQVIAVFQILYEPLVMTNGGPNNASISIMQLVYNYAFRDYKYPMAAALSVMICIVLIILSGIYFKLTTKKED